MSKVMSLQIIREIEANLHLTQFYTITTDETEDASNKKQVVLCFRWVSDDLTVHEDFIGFYQTDCYGHALNLTCSDTIKTIKLMGDSLDTAREITKFIKDSPSRDDIFTKLKVTISPGAPGTRALCPTRWTVQAESLRSLLENFETLQLVW